MGNACGKGFEAGVRIIAEGEGGDLGEGWEVRGECGVEGYGARWHGVKDTERGNSCSVRNENVQYLEGDRSS